MKEDLEFCFKHFVLRKLLSSLSCEGKQEKEIRKETERK